MVGSTKTQPQVAQQERENMHKPSVKKVLKVLLRKSKGLNRVERIEEMYKGLTALGLVVCRQKRDNGISFVSYETIDYIDNLLKRVKQSRLNPRTVFKQLEFSF